MRRGVAAQARDTTVCVCVSVPSVTAQRGCNATKTNSFYRLLAMHVLLDFDLCMD